MERALNPFSKFIFLVIDDHGGVGTRIRRDNQPRPTPSSPFFFALPVLARFYTPMLGREIDPMTEIITTVGATEAIFSTINAFIGPGDKVVLMSPHYDSYPASVIMAGGEPVYVQMRPKKGVEMPKTSDEWEPDWEELERVLETDKKIKMVLLNNPHNPLGEQSRAGRNLNDEKELWLKSFCSWVRWKLNLAFAYLE